MEEGEEVQPEFGSLMCRRKKRREVEEVCPRGCGALKWQSCGHGTEAGEEEHLYHRYETLVVAPGELCGEHIHTKKHMMRMK